jgi:pimeloyl-ACP methyl ester carboxylesterase
VPVIMLMARWGSEVIMRYIAEAPLRTITAVYIAGSAGSSADTLSIKDDWGEAVGPSTTEGLPAHAIEDAEELLEPPPARSATDKFALNLTRNHLHVIAARECWEKVYPGRTRCGRDYKNSEWSALSSVVEFHEKGGREHMVFKCHKCAKPPEWAELCTDSTVLSDSD